MSSTPRSPIPAARPHRSLGRDALTRRSELARGTPTLPYDGFNQTKQFPPHLTAVEVNVGQLADVVEHAYERDELPDWELVFELGRRAMSAEANALGHGAIGAARQGY